MGLDATSGLFAGEGHIPLAATPDPVSAAPLSGFSEPAEVTFEFANEVERVVEIPRVTKPYSDVQFDELLALGDQVEEALQAGDVRLTMGGEPTFVSETDQESEQWNEDADGPDKRRLAYDLAVKLKAEFAPDGFIHQGQGKWYPGEPIPRWQYAIYWREDDTPLWTDPRDVRQPYQRLPGRRHPRRQLRVAPWPSNSAYPPTAASPPSRIPFTSSGETGNLPTNIDPRKIDPPRKARAQDPQRAPRSRPR